MNIITGDLETFWSPQHSLTVMNPFDYCMHKETEIISNSLKIDNSPSHVVFGEANVRAQLADVDWDQAYFIAHNMSGFDAIIYAWRLGIRPKYWGCTLAMARALYAKTHSLSLAKQVELHKVGFKNNAVLLQTKGRHLKDFTQDEIKRMAVYNGEDTDQCYGIFKAMRPHFTSTELWHMDSKIRCMIEPKFVLDVPLLEAALKIERANKKKALLTIAEMFKAQVFPAGDIADVDEDYLLERVRATLASAPMFCEVLTARGVPVPMKESPTNPDNLIPALAKTDLEFINLQEHEDELVAMAATARLSVKSTIAETRMQAFIDVSRYADGKWPVTVNYCGADTTGRSSGWLYNPLNMNKIIEGKPKPSDAMRLSLMAPDGYKVVVVDASGIEMRFNHFLWNVRYSTDLWKASPEADIYKPTAARFYMVDVSEVDKSMRQTGKVQQLACGFGCGGARYVDMARTMGGLRLSIEEATNQVKSWREMTPEIAHYKDGGWASCQESLEAILNGLERPIDPRGIFWTCAEGIRLPSGRLIRYPDLRREKSMRKVTRNGQETVIDDWTWKYGAGRHTTFIHGPKADENIVQAGARDLVYDAAFEIFKRTGHRPVLEVYDELAYIVPEDEAEQHLAICNEELRRPPSWFPDIVLWSEGDIGDRYGEAK